MTTYRPFSLTATTPRRRKIYPLRIIYHIGRAIVAIASAIIVAACIGAM